ncbi:uncharacterized protein YjiS (DUF1127 family) [Bradyrhizobium sp. F1.13.4]
MSATYSEILSRQIAGSTLSFLTLFKKYRGAFKERRRRQRLRTALCNLSDRELMDIAPRAARSTMSRRVEVSTREASAPPDEHLKPATNGDWSAGEHD